MAGIGGVTCTFLSGGIQDLKEETEVWRTPGIDGYGAQKKGLGDSAFQFVAVLYDSAANSEDWIRDLEALQGSAVSAEDDFELSYYHLLVTQVQFMDRVGAHTPTEDRYRTRVLIRGIVTGDLESA
jgi:hypothetical protein